MSSARSPLSPEHVVRTVLSYATVVLLVVSASLNLVQASRLGAFAGWTPAQPAPGTTAPPVHVTSPSGQELDLQFQGRPTILYYFSPACGWCEKNWLNVKALMAATDGRFHFIGLTSAPDVTGYLQAHRLSFEVYSGLRDDVARQYHFGGTPHTVVISGDGRVLHNWVGAYTAQQQREIEASMHVALPGLFVLPSSASVGALKNAASK